MAALFASGRVLDGVLVVFLCEGVLLFLLRRPGVGFLRLLPMLLSGGFLAVAARLLMAGAPWGLAAVALLAAGVAHVLDLRGRLASREADI